MRRPFSSLRTRLERVGLPLAELLIVALVSLAIVAGIAVFALRGLAASDEALPEEPAASRSAAPSAVVPLMVEREESTPLRPVSLSAPPKPKETKK